MIPTVEMVEAGWKAGLGLNKLHVERILVAALAVAPPEDDVTALKRLANSVGLEFTPHQQPSGGDVLDPLFGTCVLVIPHAAFGVGDQVEKHTGDYHAKGEVRGIFAMKNGAIRYVVEHPAEGGGSFCHIYSEKNLRKVRP